MKKLFLFAVAILTLSNMQAQDAFNIQMEVYRSALKHYELQTAITSLYNAMALKPERKDLKDSLAVIFFSAERYFQANSVAEEIYVDNPKRIDMLEMAAICKQSLGAMKESLSDFETLYKQKQDLATLYQIATLQYQLKRYGEAVFSCDQIINNTESEKRNVSIKAKAGDQNVPLRAATLNVKGIIALDLNQDDAAKKMFEEALKIFPDFMLAKANLALLAPPVKAPTPSTVAKPQTPANRPENKKALFLQQRFSGIK